MKIAIVNDIHAGKALIHKETVRASSHLIEDKLKSILLHIVQLHSPDLIINLGDLIRSEEKDQDLMRYSRLLSHFSNLHTPVIHLLGNHELKKMTEGDLENAWLKHGFDQRSFGNKTVGDFQLIWLGLKLDPQHPRRVFLPNEQIDWLKEKLRESDQSTLIFSHCPLDDHDTEGNFFYEAMDNRSKESLFFDNAEAVRSVIALSPHVKAVFQAHLHYFNVQRLNNVAYVTCPAMGDNICGPHIQDNIPEICTIVTIDQEQLIVKAFSQSYCFAGYSHALGSCEKN